MRRLLMNSHKYSILKAILCFATVTLLGFSLIFSTLTYANNHSKDGGNKPPHGSGSGGHNRPNKSFSGGGGGGGHNRPNKSFSGGGGGGQNKRVNVHYYKPANNSINKH